MVTIIGFCALGAIPTATALLSVQVVRRSSDYAVARPTREVLYTVAEREDRYKTKNFIDTVVWRFGDLVVTTGFRMLLKAGTTLPGFTAIAMLAAVGSGWLGWRVVRTPELAYESR